MKRLELTHKDATPAKLLAVVTATPGAWIGLKVAALLLLRAGLRPGQVATWLQVPRMTLSRWVHRVNAEGAAGVRERPKPGRPPRITPGIARQLDRHLAQPPTAFGLPRAQWDGPTLVVHLRRHFGVPLRVRQAQQWFHRLGYRLKQASYTYLQARASDARRFGRRLKKTPRPGPG